MNDRLDRQLSWIVGFLRWWTSHGRFGLPVDPVIAERREIQARILDELTKTTRAGR